MVQNGEEMTASMPRHMMVYEWTLVQLLLLVCLYVYADQSSRTDDYIIIPPASSERDVSLLYPLQALIEMNVLFIVECLFCDNCCIMGNDS